MFDNNSRCVSIVQELDGGWLATLDGKPWGRAATLPSLRYQVTKLADEVERATGTKPKLIGVNVDIQEATETAELLSTLTIEDLAETLDPAVDALREAMNVRDEITAAQTKACAALKKALDEACAPFKAASLANAAVLAEAKAAIIRRLTADDDAAYAAVLAKVTPPAPRALPQGLQVKRETVLRSVDLEALDEKYTCVVANTDAILAAAEAGVEVTGAVTAIELSVQLRRS